MLRVVRVEEPADGLTAMVEHVVRCHQAYVIRIVSTTLLHVLHMLGGASKLALAGIDSTEGEVLGEDVRALRGHSTARGVSLNTLFDALREGTIPVVL